MAFIKIIVITLSIILVTGCVGTNLVIDQSYKYEESDSFAREITDDANISEQGMSIFEARLDSRLDQLGLSSSNKANRIIEITFTRYYMRHGATRVFAGVMAGADNITSTVVIRNVINGDIVGKWQVVSKNPTTTGSAKGLIEQHADKIVDYIKSGKS